MSDRQEVVVTLDIQGGVATISLDRPGKANAFDDLLWHQLRHAIDCADQMPEVRSIVLKGKGRHFSAGIDLDLLAEWLDRGEAHGQCPALFRDELRRWIIELQETITRIERCRKPVVACIHGVCFGAAVDLVSACDLRYCTDDTVFCVKEIDFGIVADLGVLQRLPGIVGDGVARELILTARAFDGTEAARIGFVSASMESHSALKTRVQEIAETLAKKPALAMRGCKEAVIYSRDHTVEDGLIFVASLNSAILLSAQLNELVLNSGRDRDRPK